MTVGAETDCPRWYATGTPRRARNPRPPGDGPRMRVAMPDHPTVRVLLPFKRIRPTTNPYLTQLVAALDTRPGVDLTYFSWRRALLGGYDVFHVHWPEILFEGHKRSGRAVRRVLTAMFL